MQFFETPVGAAAKELKDLWKLAREAWVSGSLFGLLSDPKDKVKLRKKTKDLMAVVKSQSLELLPQLQERATLAITMKL